MEYRRSPQMAGFQVTVDRLHGEPTVKPAPPKPSGLARLVRWERRKVYWFFTGDIDPPEKELENGWVKHWVTTFNLLLLICVVAASVMRFNGPVDMTLVDRLRMSEHKLVMVDSMEDRYVIVVDFMDNFNDSDLSLVTYDTWEEFYHKRRYCTPLDSLRWSHKTITMENLPLILMRIAEREDIPFVCASLVQEFVKNAENIPCLCCLASDNTIDRTKVMPCFFDMEEDRSLATSRRDFATVREELKIVKHTYPKRVKIPLKFGVTYRFYHNSERYQYTATRGNVLLLQRMLQFSGVKDVRSDMIEYTE